MAKADNFLSYGKTRIAELQARATWLIHAANYAFALNRPRMVFRPRLFGLCVDPWPVPKAYEHISFEWLAEGTYENLLLGSE